jgi:hypothetical protein
VTNNTATAIDRLGELKAKIADLEEEAYQLRQIVLELGVGSYDGKLFRATVSQFERATLDLKAVREKLSPQFIRANTRHKEVTTVTVTQIGE